MAHSLEDGKQYIGRNPGPEEYPMSNETGTTPDSAHEEEQVDLAFGYTIGVKENGGLFFQLHGEQKGSVELLGLNLLARKQIDTLVDANLQQGVPHLVQGLNAIYAELLELRKQLSPPAPPAPNNALKLDE